METALIWVALCLSTFACWRVLRDRRSRPKHLSSARRKLGRKWPWN
jgi:hypothetical protein